MKGWSGTAAELVHRLVFQFCREFIRTGKLQAGTNGPRGHTMTWTRSACHWAYAACAVYSWDPDKILLDVIERFRNMLLSSSMRPTGYTFIFRNVQGGDHCNGLIGPAWSIEALFGIARMLGDEKCADLAESLFFMHPYDQSNGLWHIREVDGTVGSLDRTLDHQLWFAACASEVFGRRRSELAETVVDFLSQLSKNLLLREDGRIQHYVYDRRPLWRKTASVVKKRIVGRENTVEAREPIEHLEAGYHAFSTYALAILARTMKEHPFISSAKLFHAGEYLRSAKYETLLEHSMLGYYYNPPGFEVPVSAHAFHKLSQKELVSTTKYWLNRQIQKTFDLETMHFGVNSVDPITLHSRIYEIARLPYNCLCTVDLQISTDTSARHSS